MPLERLENIAYAATALTKRQLPYLVNYYHLNVLFSKTSDCKSEKVSRVCLNYTFLPPLPHLSAPHKNEMKPNISQQRGQCTRCTQQSRYMRRNNVPFILSQKIKRVLIPFPLQLSSKVKFIACHILSLKCVCVIIISYLSALSAIFT